MTDRPTTRTLLTIAAALLLWASAFAGIRAGLVLPGSGTSGYGPGELALLRFGTASLVLAVYALASRMRLPDARDIPAIVGAGLLGISIYHVALNFGEMTVSAGAAALLISASPVFTALMSMVLLKERLSRWGWIGVLVSFAGVVLITLGEGGNLEIETGAILVLIASITTSTYFIVSKPLLRRYSALEFTSYAIWAGTVPMLVFAPGLVAQIPDASASATLAGVYLGVFPGATAYVLWSSALSKMPASLLSTFLYFQPVNATVIAWFWLGEVPGVLSIVGGAIALAGVVIVNTKGVPSRGPLASTDDSVAILPADTSDLTIESARDLFRDYHDWLGDVVCSRTMTQEIESLPEPYAGSGGRLLLAKDGSGAVMGCIGIRPLEGPACEIKRLYVRPEHRGSGVGRMLAIEALETARQLGYMEARLTTLPESMPGALATYRSIGFVEVDPFYDHSHVDPDTEMIFMSVDLTSATQEPL
ncbi:MAG: GNAT family N-acetyltransferase [Actinomycetota bacterium]|nr:GNAT family N-acetyltransferase [Actinomycetota bacterium]